MIDRTRSRPATRADILRFYGRIPDKSVRARVLEQDGEILGVAGYYMAGGTAVVFSDVKEKEGEKVKIPKFLIWRESVALMKTIKMRAICVGSEESSKFLERLGWVHVGPSPAGEVYEWVNY